MSTATNNVTQQIQDSVSSLYIAFFGRAPDAFGFGHWCKDLAAGASVFTVAANFARSPEFVSSYAGLTPAQQVNRFYQNTFNRDADTAGLNYWVNAINSGTPFSTVAYQIIWAAYLGGPNVDPQDNLLVNNKIDVAEYFAEVLTSNDTAIAATAFVGVTQDPATVDAAEARLAAAVGSPDTYTLTTSPDTAMAQNFLAPKAYTPGGNDLVNTLQNEDVLTGNVAAGATSMTADIGNPNDSGSNVIAPSITNVDTINVAFTNTAGFGNGILGDLIALQLDGAGFVGELGGMTLDFQDIAGTETANITRISANIRNSFANLDSDVSTLGISNTSEQAKVTITYLNKELEAANNAVTLNLDNASLSSSEDEFAFAGAALQIVATPARGSELQHQIETYNINTVGSASSIATFETGVSSFDDLTVGERPQTININAVAGLDIGTLRWLGSRVETESANAMQVVDTHQVGLNGEGFVDFFEINNIAVTGSANVTLANVGMWETESDADTDTDFTLNASALTGRLTVDIGNAAGSVDATFTGGQNGDRFYMTGLNDEAVVLAAISGGAGNDSLTVQSVAGATVDLLGSSTGLENLNLVQSANTVGPQNWTSTLTNDAFTAITFNNQDTTDAMNNTLTGMNGQTLSVRSTGLNGAGDLNTTAQGAVNVTFTQAAALLGGTINLELGHASDDRGNKNIGTDGNDSFSWRNFTSNVSIIDAATSTNEAASLNLVVNTAGALGTGAANITVANDDFETLTTLSSQVSATNIVNIGQQIATNSSDYSTVDTNALNSTTYNGSSYLGPQNVTFGSTVATTATTGKSHNITTGVAADRIDLSYMTTSAARTTAGFAQSSWLLGTSINGGGAADELVLSATLADPRVVLTPDVTYDGYFQNWSNIETLTINNRNAIGSTYVAMDAYAQTNNANLGTVNFADVNGELALGFRFTNNMVVNVDATGADTNQQAAKTTTLNSFSTANNTINVNASLPGNNVVYTSTGANLANIVTLNYNSITNAGLNVNGVVGGNDDLIVTAGSLDVVTFAGDLGNVAAAAGNMNVVAANSWTASGQTTSYSFANVINSIGTALGTVTFDASAEDNSTGLTIVGSTDGSSATAGVNNVITGSEGNFANGFGNDTITSGGYQDVITGLGGNDTVTWTNATAVLATSANISGGAGNDNLTANAASVNALITIDGGTGNDTIVVAGAGTTTLLGGLGLDSITGGTGIDNITAGENADSVTISSGGVDTVIQGADDSNKAVTTDFGVGYTITAGDTMTFSNGVDVVRGFTAGAAGDVLKGAGVTVSQSIFGQNANALATYGWISGVYDVANQRFTVTANGDGPDTAFVQITGTGGTNLIAGLGVAVNQSVVIMLGVDSDNLTNANFGNSVNVTAAYAGTTWTFTGETSGVILNVDATTGTISPAGINQTGVYAPAGVTIINFSALTGGAGVNVNLSGALNTALTSVVGTVFNDNFTFADGAFLGSSATTTITGGVGTDTLTFATLTSAGQTLGSGAFATAGKGNISGIEDIVLSNGTSSGTLTLDSTLTVASNGSAVAVSNASATAGADVNLGTGAAHSYTSASSGADVVTLGLVATAPVGQTVRLSGGGADNVNTTVAASVGSTYIGSTVSTEKLTFTDAGTINLAATASATAMGIVGVDTVVLTAGVNTVTVTAGQDIVLDAALAGANLTTVVGTGNNITVTQGTTTTSAITVSGTSNYIVNGGSGAINALITDTDSQGTLRVNAGNQNTSVKSASTTTVDVSNFIGDNDTLTIDGTGNFTVLGLGSSASTVTLAATHTGTTSLATGSSGLTLTSTAATLPAVVGLTTVDATLLAADLTITGMNSAITINNLIASGGNVKNASGASVGVVTVNANDAFAHIIETGSSGDFVTVVNDSGVGAGQQTISTFAGADTINISGITGASTIDGGAGADRITLGNGADRVIVTASFVNDMDTITGFTVGSDKFQIGSTPAELSSQSIATADVAGLAAAFQNAATAAGTGWNAVGDILLVTVNAGTAAGTYVLVNKDTDTVFDNTTDLAFNIAGISGGSLVLSDFIS